MVSETSYCALYTLSALNLDESGIELRFSPSLALDNGRIALRLSRGNTDYLSLVASSEGAWSETRLENVPLSTALVPTSGITRMRIVSEAGRVRWEIESENGLVALQDQPAPFLLNGLNLAIRLESPTVGTALAIAGINAD